MINETHRLAMINFLRTKTKHNVNKIKINKGRKSDYSVTIDDKVRVNFWVSGDAIYYGLVDWGISTQDSIERLIKI